MLSARRLLQPMSEDPISARTVATSAGLPDRVSLRVLLGEVVAPVLVWRGFRHAWEYNHRVNRFGSWLEPDPGDPRRWTVGHAAASGSGPDTARFTDLYTVVRNPHLWTRADAASFRIRSAKGALNEFSERVHLRLADAGSGFGARPAHAVVLNGFDLVATAGANKLMEFEIGVSPSSLSSDATELTFTVHGALRAHCKTPECGDAPRTEYELTVRYLVLLAEADALQAVRSPPIENSYAWDFPDPEKEIFAGDLGEVEAIVDGAVLASGADLGHAVGFHQLRLELEKTGGHPALHAGKAPHLLEWDMALLDVEPGRGSLRATLLLFFKNWTQGMKNANPPASSFSFKEKGRARFEAEVTALQMRGATEVRSEGVSGEIEWRVREDSRGPAAVHESRV